MSESLTEGAVQNTDGLQAQPTDQSVEQQSAESANQETISREQSQEAVSDDTANTNQQQEAEGEKQTQQTGGDSKTDDGLAKFAKSQGFDLENASDEVKRALKIAHDNQKAFRSNTTKGPKVSEATSELDDGSLRAEVEQLKYEKQADRFFEDGRDRSLEPLMVEIINEKAEQYGKEYAFALSRDLDALYAQAQVKSGNFNAQVDPEQIRREERESINRQLSTSAPQAHAVNQGHQSAPKITQDWIQNEYDSKNPEHVKMVDEFFSQKS